MSINNRPYRIGWIVDSAPSRAWSFPWQELGPVSRIRYGHVAGHIHKTDSQFQMERYLPFRRYDVVVIVKKLNAPVLTLAQSLKKAGTRLIFDSNVNYYETWGTYDIPGTEPRPDQIQMAKEMTSLANLVVADSTYLASPCRLINPQTTMIPDAVDTIVYSPSKGKSDSNGPLRLIWSGISKKAHHLQLVEPIAIRLKDRIQLHLVINKPHPHDPPSPVIERLRQKANARVSYYSYSGYVKDLQQADIILSPKILSSAYEMAHTEYKITSGMAVGLPAMASPQQSYLEAIGAEEGGWICQEPSDWDRVLQEILEHPERVRERGARARERVLKHYAVPVVAELYKKAIIQVLQEPS